MEKGAGLLSTTQVCENLEEVIRKPGLPNSMLGLYLLYRTTVFFIY